MGASSSSRSCAGQAPETENSAPDVDPSRAARPSGNSAMPPRRATASRLLGIQLERPVDFDTVAIGEQRRAIDTLAKDADGTTLDGHIRGQRIESRA